MTNLPALMVDSSNATTTIGVGKTSTQGYKLAGRPERLFAREDSDESVESIRLGQMGECPAVAQRPDRMNAQ